VKQAVLLVRLTMPPGMDPRQVALEVMHSISFGSPLVEFLYAEELRLEDDAVG
jgi:hypothetical protein